MPYPTVPKGITYGAVDRIRLNLLKVRSDRTSGYSKHFSPNVRATTPSRTEIVTYVGSLLSPRSCTILRMTITQLKKAVAHVTRYRPRRPASNTDVWRNAPLGHNGEIDVLLQMFGRLGDYSHTYSVPPRLKGPKCEGFVEGFNHGKKSTGGSSVRSGENVRHDLRSMQPGNAGLAPSEIAALNTLATGRGLASFLLRFGPLVVFLWPCSPPDSVSSTSCLSPVRMLFPCYFRATSVLFRIWTTLMPAAGSMVLWFHGSSQRHLFVTQDNALQQPNRDE